MTFHANTPLRAARRLAARVALLLCAGLLTLGGGSAWARGHPAHNQAADPPAEEIADPVLRELSALHQEIADLKAMVQDLQDAVANGQSAPDQPGFAPRVPGLDDAPAPDAQTTPATENLPSPPPLPLGPAKSSDEKRPPTKLLAKDASNPAPTDARNAAAPDTLPEAPAAPAQFSIVREWGRTAAEAKLLPKGAASLKGMILAVPADSPRGSVEQLGRDLRTQYIGYDNINIEIFDDRDAAEQFVKSNVSNPAHRILSVSKYKDTGRDVILSIHDGMTVELQK